MDWLLIVALMMAIVFAFTNGVHDSSNAVAALVATRVARPAQAVALAATFHIVGPILLGTAVANTVGGIVQVGHKEVVAVVGAGLSSAVAWNLLTWWRGLPSSSSHALVGGLVGAAVFEAGGTAVRWGGLNGIFPIGVLGVLFVLAISPILGFVAGLLLELLAKRLLRRARTSIETVIRRSEWVTGAALAFSHGANDASKASGVITLLLLAHGEIHSFDVPVWVKLVAAMALTAGTALGGWRIVRTVGSGIYRIRPLDGLISQGGSAAIIFGSALVGGPVSTTHVVASSIAGVGSGRRWRHVRWAVMGEILLAWVVTLPASAILGAIALLAWRPFV
ncbi:MAG: inorganic phosphate transporter [Candidatus Dormiibacterota bacterium]